MVQIYLTYNRGRGSVPANHTRWPKYSRQVRLASCQFRQGQGHTNISVAVPGRDKNILYHGTDGNDYRSHASVDRYVPPTCVLLFELSGPASFVQRTYYDVNESIFARSVFYHTDKAERFDSTRGRYSLDIVSVIFFSDNLSRIDTRVRCLWMHYIYINYIHRAT